MPTFGTNAGGINMVVDISTAIEGNYPDAKLRVNFGVYFTAQYAQNSLQWNGATFYFDGSAFSLSVNGIGAGRYPSSGYACSGYKRYDFGNDYTLTKSIRVSTAFGNFSSSGNLSAGGSIPAPTKFECGNPRNITPTSATIDYFLTNKNNYWRVYLWDKISGKTWNISPDNGNGTKTLTDLTPETNYQITTKVVDRKGTVRYTGGVFATFKTLTDQLKIYFNDNGVIKVAKVFYNSNGVIKKVKKAFTNVDGVIKRVANAGVNTLSISAVSLASYSMDIETNANVIEDGQKEYTYTYGEVYEYKGVNYLCLDCNSMNPSESYGQTFTSQFTPNYLIGRKFEVVKHDTN